MVLIFHYGARVRGYFLLILVVLVFLFSSCAGLPDYAKPRVIPQDESTWDPDEGFEYRELQKADFLAAESPNFKEHLGNVRAQSCITIRPADDLKGSITPVTYYGRSYHVGSISNFRLEAVFVPGCSWWNPENPLSKYPYVLQHEQVHFAISQYWAQKGTVEIRDQLNREVFFGDTADEVQAKISEFVLESLQHLRERSVEMHTEFDEECSLFFDPEKQQEWLDRMVEEINRIGAARLPTS